MARKSNKYYIIRRNSQELINDFLCEFAKVDRDRFKLDSRLPLLLIEKTCHKDNTETYTNLWTVFEGCDSNWTKYTKGRVMYDYTGIAKPIIHVKDKKYTWEQYQDLPKI
jgi:hypothetical protein